MEASALRVLTAEYAFVQKPSDPPHFITNRVLSQAEFPGNLFPWTFADNAQAEDAPSFRGKPPDDGLYLDHLLPRLRVTFEPL